MNTPIRIYIILTLLATFWCVGFVAAPVLAHLGYNADANELYSFYSQVCHQQDVRSFHIVDQKFAVCIRCTSLYIGFLCGLISVSVFRKVRQKRILNKNFLLIPLTLILLDVGLQVTRIHTSSAWTRICSGSLFGIAASWFVLPFFIEAVTQLIQRKKIPLSDSGEIYGRETP